MIVFVDGIPKIINKVDFNSDKEYYKQIIKLADNKVISPKLEKDSFNFVFYKKQVNKL